MSGCNEVPINVIEFMRICRHKDILPYEENRVRLSPTRDNKYGYINGSNITASVGNHQKFYIAAQSPLPSTISHFWQMIWESDVYLVVSLADTNDCNTVPYYHSSITDKTFETGEVNGRGLVGLYVAFRVDTK